MPRKWVKVSPIGRLSLPADIRRRLGLQKGGDLVVRSDEDGVVTLMTAEAAVRHL